MPSPGTALFHEVPKVEQERRARVPGARQREAAPDLTVARGPCELRWRDASSSSSELWLPNEPCECRFENGRRMVGTSRPVCQVREGLLLGEMLGLAGSDEGTASLTVAESLGWDWSTIPSF